MNSSLSRWLETLESRHPVSIDLDLQRCGEVYRRMGSPRPAPVVITVGGTNGKGSVVAYLAAMSSALGLRYGTYTSPHLIEFNERVRIEGISVTDQQLVDAFNETEVFRENVSLTYFEFTTLAAFRLMKAAELDFAILEVGLGGRLDTVNLVDADCAVITNIGLDHQNFLGQNRESIGYEKAGIMRSNSPVVCGDRYPPSSLLCAANSVGSQFLRLGKDFDWQLNASGIKVTVQEAVFDVSIPGLRGQHQFDNLATATAAMVQLFKSRLLAESKWKSSPAKVAVSGRLSGSQLDPRIIFDVGHNPLAAKVVMEHLAGIDHAKLFCVLGMLRDKDANQVAKQLSSVVDEWVCAGLTGPRGQSGAELAEKLRQSLPNALLTVSSTVSDALITARHRAGVDDLILVFGSFETVGAAMRELQKQ